MSKKAISIEIIYDDDSVDYAKGDAARQIKEWYDSAEVMLCVHGGSYSGPKFQVKSLSE